MWNSKGENSQSFSLFFLHLHPSLVTETSITTMTKTDLLIFPPCQSSSWFLTIFRLYSAMYTSTGAQPGIGLELCAIHYDFTCHLCTTDATLWQDFCKAYLGHGTSSWSPEFCTCICGRCHSCLDNALLYWYVIQHTRISIYSLAIFSCHLATTISLTVCFFYVSDLPKTPYFQTQFMKMAENQEWTSCLDISEQWHQVNHMFS